MTEAILEQADGGAVSGRGPVRLVLDFFSSIWLGITLATLLFVYCTIGSAMPGVRQHPAIELTEFEWFHWWPFNVLVILFCLNITVVTLRRIPFRLTNAGVWAIHSGIVILCLGSYYYFTTKIEGDMPVFRRRVVIEVPGASQPTSLVCLPGSRARVGAAGATWRFQIQSTTSQWPILSGDHQGERVYSANVLVTPPSGDTFVRQLLAGFPQYTEDIIPGKGRALKSTGRRLLREDLKLSFDYEPQTTFHVMDTWALFVRRVGDAEWAERPIKGLPRYHDRIASRDQVFTDPHYPIRLRSLDLSVPPPPGGDALGSVSAHITGYLRYAQLQQRWRDGGEELNPVLRMSVLSGNARADTHELLAFDRTRNRSSGGMVQFMWLDDFSKTAELPTDSRALLRVEVPAKQIALDLSIARDTVVGSEGPFTPVEGSEFSYRIISLQDGLMLPGSGRVVSVAMVDIKTPAGQFTRMVADQPHMTRDMHGDSDPHAAGGRSPQQADDRIRMFYHPQTAPILLAGHPRGLFLVVNGPDGRVLGRDVDVGELVEVVGGLSVRADALITHAVTEVKPFVVPPASRERRERTAFAMIRLEIESGGRRESKWVRFSQYALPDEQYAYGGRFAYRPAHFHMPAGPPVEIIFSRERAPLPAPIALDHFELDTHIGGYTGQVSTIRNYVSHLRFFDGDAWTEAAAIRVNAPTEYGGFWYFQSMWDKPPTDDPGGGMNYTGLGVGNRNGVYVQLAGCCICVCGMIFAFYVKPILKRRRAERSCEEVLRGGEADVAQRADAVTPDTVNV